MHENAAEECNGADLITISLHEVAINVDELVQSLLKTLKHPVDTRPQIIHIDLSHTVSIMDASSEDRNPLSLFQVQHRVDDVLFSMLILGSLTHSSGHMWTMRPEDLHLIECLPLKFTQRSVDEVSLGTIHDK
jgi:hypothetical protein